MNYFNTSHFIITDSFELVDQYFITVIFQFLFFLKCIYNRARTRFIVFTFYLLGQFVERIFLHLLAPELRPVSPVCLFILCFALDVLGLSTERAILL